MPKLPPIIPPWAPPQVLDPAPSAVCATRALAALGYATLAAEVSGHTPLPFAELPAHVQAGWMAAARAMRQQVLEETRSSTTPP